MKNKLESENSTDRDINSEVFSFIDKLLPAVDVANIALSTVFSTRPWLTLVIALSIPAVGVSAVKFADRRGEHLSKRALALIVFLHFLICSVSGPSSPAWLMIIPGLAASIFLIPEMRYKIGFLGAMLAAAALGNYLSGKDLLTILAVTVAMGGVSVLLFSTHQFLSTINARLKLQKLSIKQEQEKSERLLLNILPEHVIAELSATGKVQPLRHMEVTVLFTDLEGFTEATSTMPPDRMVAELNDMFAAFDAIAFEEGVEKIKTIGDAYMAVAGLSGLQPDHAQRCVRAALRFQVFVSDRNREAAFKWKLRVGLHSGPVVSGVVGERKYAYDIWGNTVNIASRMESSGDAGRVNLSAYTYDLVRNDFDCTYRGKINAKGKGEIDMYFVDSLVRVSTSTGS